MHAGAPSNTAGVTGAVPTNIAQVCPKTFACAAVALQPVCPDAVTTIDTFCDVPKVLVVSADVAYVCEKYAPAFDDA